MRLLALVVLLSGCTASVSDNRQSPPPVSNATANPLPVAQSVALTESGCPTGTARTDGFGGPPCSRMSAPQRFRGTWFTNFETSTFQPIDEPEDGRRSIWLSSGPLDRAIPRAALERGTEYRVEFEGRITLDPVNFGHMNCCDRAIIVDRVISITPVREGR